jgi:hypothetical protein
MKTPPKRLLSAAVLGCCLIAASEVNAGLLGYWTFDGNYDDSSGQAHPGQAGPAPQAPIFSTDVARQFAGNPNARSLDLRNRVTPDTGTNCYAVVPGSGALFNAYRTGANPSSSFTVSCWVKGWPVDQWVPFVSKNGEGDGWQMRRSGASTDIDWTTRGTTTGFTNGNGDFSSAVVVTGAGVTQPGVRTLQWYHYACTFDGTDKKIYINSQLVSQQTNVNAKIQDSASLLVFGARDNGGINSFARIQLDDVAIWDVALTKVQILDLATGTDARYVHNQVTPWNVGEPWGTVGKWGIKEAKTLNAGWQVSNLNTALGVVMSQTGLTSTTFSTNFFSDPQSPGGGAGATAYLTNTAADDEDFVQVANCCFRIPTAGPYTFAFNGDDGFNCSILGANWDKITVNNGNATFSGETLDNMTPTGDENTYAVATLAAGDYNFRYLWYERGGGAFNRVRISPGDLSGDNASFKLLGDPVSPVKLVDQAPMLFAFNSDNYLVITTPTVTPANLTFSWDTKYTSAVAITPTLPGNPALTAGIGSVTFPSPTTTTIYTLTGTTGAQTRTKQLTIFVNQAPQINTFTVNDSTVVAGAPVTFNWNVIGAATLSINQGVGNVTPTGIGSTIVNAPAATTTYTLTATNTFGSVTANVTVNIGAPPVISSFTSPDTNLLPGGLAQLNWTTSLADSVTLSPRPGTVAANGLFYENPPLSTTYTLTATNQYASVSQTKTINLAGPLTITSAGWNQTRVTSTSSAVTSLSICDQLLAGTLAGTTFTQNGVASINQGDGAVGVFPGGETLPPGGNGDNFVVKSTATLRIYYSGYYTFGINNDDGARLRIDGANAIVDDSAHGPTSFTTSPTFLTAGDHTIEYLYFENGGGFAGECYWVRDDGTSILLSTNMPGPSVVGGTELQITEFCADNTQLEDKEAETPDWIEIFNPTASPIDLAGYFLTNSSAAADNHKWAFPSYSLPAGGFIVVFASAKNTTFPVNEFHTNFTLPKEGGYLALTKNGGSTLVDSYTYPAQREDKSYGRYDTEGYTGFFDTPSPNSPNPAGIDGFVGDTHFSVDRGIKSAPFDLTITCGDPGAEIRYTTDGSTPTSTHGSIFPNVVGATPININKTTVLRAAAFHKNWKPTNVDTESYFFLDDVILQSAANTLADGWPSSPVAGQILDYGFDSRVVTGNQAALKTSLQAIPTLSIVTDLPNLLDPVNGIYVDSGQHGENWERPCSIEYINDTYNGTTDGSGVFQINCGLRIRGGYSRSDSNPKHAFRLFFSKQYDGALKYPIFGREGTNSFAKLDVQCSQNYSWSYDPAGASPNGGYQPYTFVREVVSRDNQRDMGEPYTRSGYVHLYINGKYWGLYMTQERPEANYGESYLGGDENNYDVVKSAGGSGGYNTEATDGTMAQGTSAAPGSTWARLWYRSFDIRNDTTSEASRTARYFALQGLQANGVTPDPANQRVLDPDNLADYMINSFQTGSFDAPMSTFLANASNNWFGMMDRTSNRGFVYFAHDHEHGMATDQDGRSDNRVGPWGGAGTNAFNQGMYNSNNLATYAKSNPAYMHENLAFSLEYRVRFGDRAHRLFYNNGPLTDASMIARINARADTMRQIVLAESARWGDSKTGGATFFSKNDWENSTTTYNAMTRLRNWVNRGTIATLNAGSGPGRGATIINQLRAYKDKVSGTSTGAADATLLSMPLYPVTDAPVFSQFGGIVPMNYSLTITDPNGTNPNTSGNTRTLYYRLDGLDPREVGGTVRAGNLTASPATLTASGVVKARVFNSTRNEWSAVTSALFVVGVPASSSNLVISEINYNPKGPFVAPATSAQDYEFIEIWNPSVDQVQLAGVKFTFGIDFDFNTSSITAIPPGGRIVLVKNLAAFQQRYPDASYPGLSAKIAGVYINSLDNSGEGLILRNTIAGADIANFVYDDDGIGWPEGPDGNGSTLCFTATNPITANKNDGSNWFANALLHGNPGGPDSANFTAWAATNGVPASGTVDSDNDGASNLLEYAFGTQPGNPNSRNLPVAGLASITVGTNPAEIYQTLTFTRPGNASDLRHRAQSSSNLTGWTDSAILVSREWSSSTGNETWVYRSPTPYSANQRVYMRVLVEVIP